MWLKIGIPAWDDFFDKGNALSGKITDIKNGLYDSRLFIYKKTKIHYLKPPHNNMLEALKVYLWTLSALNDGKINEACKPKIVFEAPFLTLSVGKGDAKMQKMMNCFVNWLVAALKSALELPDIDKELD